MGVRMGAMGLACEFGINLFFLTCSHWTLDLSLTDRSSGLQTYETLTWFEAGVSGAGITARTYVGAHAVQH